MSSGLDPAPLSRGKRAARAGILTNALLAAFKLVALSAFSSRSSAAPASADDWAALGASGVIAVKAILLLRPAVADLMDRSPDLSILESIRSVAGG
jgi:divalent metal cation (Fe/Co/Zn/Cd) transporter